MRSSPAAAGARRLHTDAKLAGCCPCTACPRRRKARWLLPLDGACTQTQSSLAAALAGRTPASSCSEHEDRPATAEQGAAHTHYQTASCAPDQRNSKVRA
eukprot:365104-Chlamydomonas_euryale.AAC.2